MVDKLPPVGDVRDLVAKINEIIDAVNDLQGRFPGAVANPVEPPTVDGTTIRKDASGR